MAEISRVTKFLLLELSVNSIQSANSGKPRENWGKFEKFELILTTCQIRYHSHLWDHRSTGQL